MPILDDIEIFLFGGSKELRKEKRALQALNSRLLDVINFRLVPSHHYGLSFDSYYATLSYISCYGSKQEGIKSLNCLLKQLKEYGFEAKMEVKDPSGWKYNAIVLKFDRAGLEAEITRREKANRCCVM